MYSLLIIKQVINCNSDFFLSFHNKDMLLQGNWGVTTYSLDENNRKKLNQALCGAGSLLKSQVIIILDRH